VTQDDDIEREKQETENESIFCIGLELTPTYHQKSDEQRKSEKPVFDSDIEKDIV
jgi:hypothetical protein